VLFFDVFLLIYLPQTPLFTIVLEQMSRNVCMLSTGASKPRYSGVSYWSVTSLTTLSQVTLCLKKSM